MNGGINRQGQDGFDSELACPPRAVQELRAREVELARLNEQLCDLERAKAEFFSRVSREFRAPLALLLGPLEDILESPASALAPEARAVLQTARRDALRLAALVDSLSGMLEAEGERGTACQPVDFAAFTAELAANFRTACEWARLNLIIDCAPLARPVRVDRGAWEKIVVNLVANAFKSTTEGTIYVRLRGEDDHAQLVVRDSGAGIAESELPHLFAAHARSGSVAFGLPLVRELVQLHNGSIDVQTEPGRGSTFTVRLPLAADRRGAQAQAQAAAASPPAPCCANGAGAEILTGSAVGRGEGTQPSGSIAASSPRGRIVIAEDSADMRCYLGELLEAAGFDIEAVADGHAALAACRARPPDAVLSDVMMPGLDGFDLIKRLRADEQTAVIPVLLLSGRAGENSRIAGLAAGADDYLVKPLGRRELLARVEGAVRLARLRRETARREQADFESLFSMAFDAIIVVDREGKILTANPRAVELFGYSLEELTALQIEALIPASHREAHAGHREAYLRNPVTRLASPSGGLKVVRRDGSEFVAEIGLGPLHFRNQDCTVANVRDITVRVKAQQALQQAMTRLQALSERITRAQEEERRKIAFELHEQLGQEVSTLKVLLQMMEGCCKGRQAEERRQGALAIVGQMLNRVRTMALDLRPPELDDFGLYAALRAHCKQQADAAGWALHLDVERPGERPSRDVELACFRVVQEGLTNIVRYAKATEVWVSLTRSGDALRLQLRDDGVGFDTGEFHQGRPARSLGLIGMAERLRQVGGQFEVRSSQQGGTTIDATFPVNSPR